MPCKYLDPALASSSAKKSCLQEEKTKQNIQNGGKKRNTMAIKKLLSSHKSLFPNSTSDVPADVPLADNKPSDQPNLKYQTLLDKYKTQKLELKRLRKLNVNLQEKLFSIATRTPPTTPIVHSVATVVPPPPAVSSISEEKAFTPRTYQHKQEGSPKTPTSRVTSIMESDDDSTLLEVGPDIKVNRNQWVEAKKRVKTGAYGDSLFTKKLASVLWGASVLQQRSVTGQRCLAVKGSKPKKPLTPLKMDVLRSELTHRAQSENSSQEEINERVKKVGTCVSQKIQTLNRDAKSTANDD